MAKLYIMIGIPSSGKSHVARKLKEEVGAKIYSSDQMRLLLNMNAADDNENIDLFEYMYECIRKELSNNQNIILDSTNTFRKYRMPFIQSLSDDVEVIGVIMMRKLENCLKSNARRKNRITDDVIIDQYENYDLPLKEEGFDSFIIIYPDEDQNSLSGDPINIYESRFQNNGLSPEQKLLKAQKLINGQ